MKYLKQLTLIILLILTAGLLVRVFTTRFDVLFTSTGPAAQALFLVLIIIEVIVAPIPGGILSILGVAHFGLSNGWILLYIGNVIGSSVAFLLARHIGRPFVKRTVTPKQRKPYEQIINKYPRLFWLIYAIPILPIDIISILLGLTKVSYRRFLLITATGLISYTGIWAYVGARWLIYVPYLELISTIMLVIILVLIAYWIYKEFGEGIRKKLSSLDQK